MSDPARAAVEWQLAAAKERKQRAIGEGARKICAGYSPTCVDLQRFGDRAIAAALDEDYWAAILAEIDAFDGKPVP